jgi:hypothetical protein
VAHVQRRSSILGSVDANERRLVRRENVLVLTVIFAVSFFYWMFTANDSPSGLDTPEPAWVASGVVGMAISAVLAVRSWRLGVYLNGSSLTVRNLLSTRQVEAEQVTSIVMARVPIMGTPIPALVLKDGRTIRMTAVEPPNTQTRPKNQDAQGAMSALHQWLEEHGHPTD